MVEVGPLALRCLMRLGEQIDCLAAALAVLLTPRDPALGALQVQLGHAEDAWVSDLAAIRQGGERFQAKIDAGFLAGEWQGRDRHLGARETDVPPIGLLRNCDRLGRACQPARPAHRQAPALGDNQEPIVYAPAMAVL